MKRGPIGQGVADATQHTPPESAVARYLRMKKEADGPTRSGSESPRGPATIDLRSSRESTRVGPDRRAPKAPRPDAAQGVIDSALNELTFGLHQKGLGVTDAIIDIATRGTNATPIETYKQSTGATRERIAAAKVRHPIAKAAADAAGFFAPIGLSGKLHAALSASEIIPAARAPGAVNAIKRIGKNTALGGATGAAMTGVASDSPIEQRPAQMAVGGVVGALLGGGTTAAAEGITGGHALSKRLFRSAQSKGDDAARQQIVSGLAGNDLSPDDLIANATTANAVGSPARTAHLGGPALDNLTYIGASSASPSGGKLKAALQEAQRGEVSLLQRGITSMSGKERLPQNETGNFLRGLEDARDVAGKADYPAAYREAPIDDPEILRAIQNDPDLRAALGNSMQIIRREDELARLQSGLPVPERVNPLAQPIEAGPQLTEMGQQLIAMGVPEEKVIAAGHIAEVADAPQLPVKLIDYMKRGVEPVIQQKTAKEGLQGHDADIIRGKVQEILRRADSQRPSYQAARGRQAVLFGQEDAAKAGTKAFDNTGSQIRQVLGDLDRPGQQEAYRTTATSELRDQVDAKRFDADVGTSLFDSPQAQGQLDALYGEGARQQFDPYLEQGGILNRVLKAATGGSQTEPRQAIRAAAKDASGANIPTAMAGLRRAIVGGHSQRVERAMAETLAKELNIPANSPEVKALVDRLYQAIEKGRIAPNLLFQQPSDVSSLGLTGRLAASLSQGGQ